MRTSHGDILGAHCWTLRLVFGFLAVTVARSALMSEKSNLWNSCITFILSTMAILFMSPLGNDKEVLEKSLTAIHKMHPFVHPIFKILLYWGHSLISVYTGHIYFPSLPIQKVLAIYFNSRPHFANFPIMFLPNALLFSQTISRSPWINVDSYLWPVLLPG